MNTVLLARLFNRAMDALIGAPRWVWRVVLYSALGLAAFLLVHGRISAARDEGAQAMRDSVGAVTAVRLHRQKDSLGVRVVRQTVTVTRTVRHQDTLWRQLPESIATHADTVQVLNAIPALRQAADSTAHACTELVTACSDFHRVADSLDLARQAQIAAMQRTIDRQRPGKFSTVLKWVEIGGAFYLGWRLR